MIWFAAGLALAFPVTMEPTDAVMVDADGDGWEDLVYHFGRSIRYNEMGTFGPALPLVPGGTDYAAAIDLDADGLPELCFFDDSVLHCAPGYGRYYGAPYPIVGPSRLLMPVDFDTDGDIDFVVAEADVVLFANDNGVYTSSVISTADVAGWSWDDVNDDGLDDLVGSGWFQSPIAFPRMADGTLGPEIEMSGLREADVQFADVNGDGRSDAIYFEASVFVHYQTEDFVYGNRNRLEDVNRYFQVADLDHDGIEGMVSVGYGGVASWERNFEGVAMELGPASGEAVCVSDVDHDGMLDVLVLGWESVVHLNPTVPGGDLAFAHRPGSEGMAVGDIDGDGLPDIVYHETNGGIQWLRNAGNHGFELGGWVTQADVDPDRIRVFDYDQDGFTDVLSLSGEVLLHRADGLGGFEPGVAVWGFAQDLKVGELDGDPGWEAVIVGDEGVYVMQHDGSDVLRLPTVVRTDAQVQLVDLDGDGLDDVSVLNDNVLHVHWTNPTAAVPYQRISLGDGKGYEHEWLDTDADGDLDIVLSLDCRTNTPGCVGTGVEMIRIANAGGQFFALEPFRDSAFQQIASDGVSLVYQDGNNADIWMLGATAADDEWIPHGWSPAEDELVLVDLNADGVSDVVALGDGVVRVFYQGLDRFNGTPLPTYLGTSGSTTEPDETGDTGGGASDDTTSSSTDTGPSTESTTDAEETAQPGSKASPKSDGCGCDSSGGSMGAFALMPWRRR